MDSWIELQIITESGVCDLGLSRAEALTMLMEISARLIMEDQLLEAA